MTKARKPQVSPQVLAEKPKPATPAQPPRARADWEAIERDYRTGSFSNQELADLHGNVVSRQRISQRAAEKGWTKDLSKAVRLATNASLIEGQVEARFAGALAETCDKIFKTVLAAAEVNKQVILGHRGDIARLRKITMGQVDSLEAMVQKAAGGDKPVDPAYVLLSVSRATQSLTRLQAAERKAFSLDEPDDPASADAIAKPTLTLAQRAARLASLFAQAQSNKAAADAACAADGGVTDAAG